MTDAPRWLRVALVAMIAAATVSATRLAAPGGVAACSCAPLRTLAEYRDEPSIVILAGTIAVLNGNGGVFAVERVFKGPISFANLQIDGGDPAMCGISLKAAAHVVMVAHMDAGVLQPSNCRPFATLPSPEGDALLAEAEAAYGGAGPPEAPVEPTNPPEAGPTVGPDAALPIALLLGIGVAIVLFGLVFLVARRARPDVQKEP